MPVNPVIIILNPDELTNSERRQALESVNLIKYKINWIIKGRTCANGRKKKMYLKEEESVASTMVSLECLFTTLVIDAYEGREVPTFDVPGA